MHVEAFDVEIEVVVRPDPDDPVQRHPFRVGAVDLLPVHQEDELARIALVVHLEQVGGDYVSISLSSLDNASIDELVSGPVHYSDGRHNNWMNPPADVRNL